MNDRLERLAERAGMSRAELSRRAGLSDGYLSSTLSKVRADPTFTPDLATLRSIAEAAGVSLRWLETGEGGRTPRPATSTRRPLCACA